MHLSAGPLAGGLTTLCLGLVLTTCAGASDVPTGEECRSLVKEQAPDLKARADALLTDGTALVVANDCDSGGWPSVYAGLRERPEAVVERMHELGSAEEVENTECLKYLSAAECDRTWRYTPADGEPAYSLSLPLDASGEFAIAVDSS